MPYVTRDELGHITSILREPGATEAEFLPGDHPDILAFIEAGPTKAELAALDMEFIRVIEDLLDILMQKNLVRFTDLPAPVREKLLKRRSIRHRNEDPGLVTDVIEMP